MSNDELLSYLRSYVADPKIIKFDQLTDEEKKDLPKSWIDILSFKDRGRIDRALFYWRQYKAEFEQVVEYLEVNLESVYLIHHDSEYSLLYGVKSTKQKRVLYYEARNPKTKQIASAVASVWGSLPQTLRSFYGELHNGWFYFASRSMGLSPVEDFFFLSQEDWGILDEIGEPPVDLERTLAVFTNGMGGYVCLEFKDNKYMALLWWSHKPPRLNIDFWPVMDSWTVMGFED